jgi:hypothetical protein
MSTVHILESECHANVSKLVIDEAKFRKDEQRMHEANVKTTNDEETRRRQYLAKTEAANPKADKRVWTYNAARYAAHIAARRECDGEIHRVNEEFIDALVKPTTLLYQV